MTNPHFFQISCLTPGKYCYFMLNAFKIYTCVLLLICIASGQVGSLDQCLTNLLPDKNLIFSSPVFFTIQHSEFGSQTQASKFTFTQKLDANFK